MAGDPADKARHQGRGDVVTAVDGDSIIASTQLKEAIAKRPNQDIAFSVILRRRGADRPTSCPLEQRDQRAGSGITIRTRLKSIRPGACRSAGHERHRRTSNVRGLIFQTALGPDHARDLAETADGAGRNRAAVRRVALSSDVALVSLMASLSLESRSSQPAADSGAGRRSHLHHGARRARAPRLQQDGQRRRCCWPASSR